MLYRTNLSDKVAPSSGILLGLLAEDHHWACFYLPSEKKEAEKVMRTSPLYPVTPPNRLYAILPELYLTWG